MDERQRYISNMILTVFYQFFETRQLDRADSAIDEYTIEDSSDKTAARRLHFITRILRSEFVPPQSRSTAEMLIENYSAVYPGDPILDLMRAAAAYSSNAFQECSSAISQNDISNAEEHGSVELGAAYIFFRGACRLKYARLDATSGGRNAKLAYAYEDFVQAEHLATTSLDGNYRSLALPDAINFEGITTFYEGRSRDAIGIFNRAASHATGSLRARALNSAGFANLVDGNLDAAESLLTEALEADSNFPYARSNLGYVMIAQGNLAGAEEEFKANADDVALQKESLRDVILANLSLAELYDERGASLSSVNARYGTLMAQIGGNSFAGVEPDATRYALLAEQAVDLIYLKGNYYGLEPFALVLLCKAEGRLMNVSDLNSNRVRGRLYSEIAALRGRVPENWLFGQHRGWFAPLDRCG
jgi:hypothetical protein